MDPRTFDPLALPVSELRVPRGDPTSQKFRIAMRLNGVDLSAWPGGPCSAAHDGRDMEQTLASLRASLRMLREERELA